MLDFDSDINGIVVEETEYLAGKDGVLIYDKTKKIQANKVTLQMSTNTSTLIPALRILSLPYNKYFDLRNVVESQNNISFYWQPSKLAAFYNRFSTDQIDFSKRKPIICIAVDFLISNSKNLDLDDELLDKVKEAVKLLGFYEGFPIFDTATGFAKLLSRLGIHIEPESIMISTPLDKYEMDVYELAEQVKQLTGIDYSKKKNRVQFPKNEKILNLLRVK